MWFQRFIAWVRALFTAPLLDDTSDESDARASLFEGMAPPVEPEFTRRELFYPRDPLKTFGLGATHQPFPLDPPLYESPTTIPLIRHQQQAPQVEMRHDETTQPLPVASEPPAPLASREPVQPVASEPLSASLQRLADLPDEFESIDLMDDLDDMTRRLLFLRRLVRQRVYNEGFSMDQTPQQYRHSHGLSDASGETGSQN
ncbi:MAG TPA: hypothetical protein VF812_02100 [Ktedonobacterales bacterium]